MKLRWRLSRCMLWVFIAALLLARTSVPYWNRGAQAIDFDFGVGNVTVSHTNMPWQGHIFQSVLIVWKPLRCKS